MAKRQSLEGIRGSLYKDGFKILFDILMLDKSLKFEEVAIDFRSRLKGESKAVKYMNLFVHGGFSPKKSGRNSE